jgi:hypothetical protein
VTSYAARKSHRKGKDVQDCTSDNVHILSYAESIDFI